MRTDVNQALECWASRPTWFTSHPSDTRELTKAVANLRKLTPQPTQNELEEAIYHRVKDLPDLLGTPPTSSKRRMTLPPRFSNGCSSLNARLKDIF